MDQTHLFLLPPVISLSEGVGGAGNFLTARSENFWSNQENHPAVHPAAKKPIWGPSWVCCCHLVTCSDLDFRAKRSGRIPERGGPKPTSAGRERGGTAGGIAERIPGSSRPAAASCLLETHVEAPRMEPGWRWDSSRESGRSLSLSLSLGGHAQSEPCKAADAAPAPLSRCPAVPQAPSVLWGSAQSTAE